MTFARSDAQLALRSPFAFMGRVRRAARALTTAASALALATGVLTLAPAPTQADDAVPSQEYFLTTTWTLLARRASRVRG